MNSSVSIFPTIHLNGTSPEMLREGYLNAYRSVGTAIQSIESIEFNSRDYYPQGHEAWNKAVKERREQVMKLAEVQKYLLEVAEYVQDRMDERERQINN